MSEPQVPPQPLPAPPTADASTFVWGNTFLPLAPTPGSLPPLPGWAEHYSLLRDADPARFYFIDYAIFALTLLLGQRLAQDGERVGISIGQIVNAVSTVDPEPFVASEGAEFRYPLLAVYRRKSTPGEVSTSYPYREGDCEMRYILPAMALRQAEQLEPILQGVESAIESAIWQGYHPQYAPPGAPAGKPWGEVAGIQEIESGESAWEVFQNEESGGFVHLALRMSIRMKVRKGDVRGLGVRGAPVPFTGADIRVQSAAENGKSSLSAPAPSTEPVDVSNIKTDATG